MLKWFLISPFALPCPSKPLAKTGSVRRSSRKTNVSKGTGNLKIIFFRRTVSFDTFLLAQKHSQSSHKASTGTAGRTVRSVQKGSGILCVLMTTAGLLMVMSLIIRYTTYGIDIAHQRVVAEQHYFALKGLLNYGIMLAEKSVTHDDATIDVGNWLTQYTGKIIIVNKQDTVNVQACLYITSDEFIDMRQELKLN